MGFVAGRGLTTRYRFTRRLVEEVATSNDDGEGIELSFHDIEKAYPRVCRRALWDLLLKWGCDPSLLRVIKCCTEARPTRFVCMVVVLGTSFWNAALARESGWRR